MKRIVLVTTVVAALVLTVGTVFAAGGTKVCVPGQAVMADVVPTCMGSMRKTTVTVYSTTGTKVENGFTFFSQAAP